MKRQLLTDDSIDRINVCVKLEFKSVMKTMFVLLSIALVIVLSLYMAFIFLMNTDRLTNQYTATISAPQHSTVMKAVFANTTIVDKCVVNCQGMCYGYCCQAYYPYCEKSCGYCCCHN